MLQASLHNASLVARNRLPALVNSVRMFGMGSHVSDNDPEVSFRALNVLGFVASFPNHKM
jgi:hypothetical protein